LTRNPWCPVQRLKCVIPNTSSSTCLLSAKCCRRGPSGALQEQVANKMQEWFDAGLQQWDISRDAPYFGFEIPGAPGKYFYVWLDAPIGYMGSFKNLCDKRSDLNFDDWWKKSLMPSCITLSVKTSSISTACSGRHAGRQQFPQADQSVRARLCDGERCEDVQISRHLY
jgi:hypothetical protein